MPRAVGHRTAQDWAKLLGTRVLRPEEFDGIAVGPHTQGWSSLEAGQLPAVQTRLQAFLEELGARGQVIAGVLAPDEDHPIRIILKQEEAPRQPQRSTPAQRKQQYR